MSKKRVAHRAKHAAGLFDELIVDNFAGGGGASLGIERAMGRAVDVSINHDREAVALHKANHPETIHHCEDVFAVDPHEATSGRPVGLAWFSPDCKHFSRAKGGKPVSKKIRGLAWVVIRWAAKVKPRVIMLENVREFETWGPLVKTYDEDGRVKVDRDGRPMMIPCKKRAGTTFKRWVTMLRNLGYVVEWRNLNAADFGAPTYRRRLFLIARMDGVPIVWPSPTHGPGRPKPYRTAAECIDWSLPCPSIFLTREEGRRLNVIRPLAEKTMRRIAMGLKRFVLDNPKPFIVQVNHGGEGFRGQAGDRPFPTLTGKHGFGVTMPVLAPFLTAQYGERDGQQPRAHRVDQPIPVVTPRGGGGFPLISTFLAKHYGGVVGHEVDRPIGTITSVDHHSLIASNLIQYNQEKGDEVRGKSLGEPLNVVPTANRHGIVASHLTKFYGTNIGADPAEPMPTITGGGKHLGEVRAFLTKYYGTGGVGQDCSSPLHTITSKDRLGLVTVEGQAYSIADIGLRMLAPRELYRAQGFPDDYRIDIDLDGKKLSKSAQVRMCGNSVSPPVAEALVRANLSGAGAWPAREKGMVYA